MKDKDHRLPEGLPKDDGMTVPEGYFADFAARMEASLPRQPWEDQPANVMPRSFWSRIRPYAYMAAMFAGVWCMMKMFSLMSSDGTGISPERNSVLAEAISDDTFISDYYISDVDETDLLDELYDDGFTPASFNY